MVNTPMFKTETDSVSNLEVSNLSFVVHFYEVHVFEVHCEIHVFCRDNMKIMIHSQKKSVFICFDL